MQQLTTYLKNEIHLLKRNHFIYLFVYRFGLLEKVAFTMQFLAHVCGYNLLMLVHVS